MASCFNSFGRRLLSGNFLQTSYNWVTIIFQGEAKYEASLSSRYSKSSRLCVIVLRRLDIDKYNIFRLKPTVKQIVAKQVHMLPRVDQKSLATVKLSAEAIGMS